MSENFILSWQNEDLKRSKMRKKDFSIPEVRDLKDFSIKEALKLLSDHGASIPDDNFSEKIYLKKLVSSEAIFFIGEKYMVRLQLWLRVCKRPQENILALLRSSAANGDGFNEGYIMHNEFGPALYLFNRKIYFLEGDEVQETDFKKRVAKRRLERIK